jgi:hypothetical protein
MGWPAYCRGRAWDNLIQRFFEETSMEKRTKSVKLVALALAATVMALGSVAARATVISGSIQGCLLTGVADGTSAGTMQTSCATATNLFGAAASAAVDDSKTEFSIIKAPWTISADFGTDGSTSLTVTRNTAGKVIPGTHLLFALDFEGDQHLDSFGDVVLTSSTGNSIALASFLDLPVNKGVMADGSDWYDISFNDAFSFAAGEKITLTANLKTVPEPGSLALLGAVLLALGLASVKRVRRFGVGLTRLAS